MKPSPGPWRWGGTFPLALFDANLEKTGIEREPFPAGETQPETDNILLAAAAPEMRDMLLGLEWGDNDVCPWCHRMNDPHDGHLDECGLSALLERIR